MIKIGDQTFDSNIPVDDLFQQIVKYIKQNNLLIVDENDNSLDEEQVYQQLIGGKCEFQTKLVEELETETLHDVIDYLSNAEIRLDEIVEEKDGSQATQAFAEIIDSLLALTTVFAYFGVEELQQSKLNDLSQRVLEKVEQGNDKYVMEILEYEILPIVSASKNALLERKIN